MPRINGLSHVHHIKISFILLQVCTLLPAVELESTPESSAASNDSARLSSLVPAKGYKPAIWATGTQVMNAVAIDIDEQGKIFAAETFRWRSGGVLDVRQKMFLYKDDLQITTVDGRKALIDKWKDKFSPDYFNGTSEKIQVLSDTHGTGKADSSTTWAADFKDSVDGPAAGILAWEGTIYLANIPKIYALSDRSSKGVADERKTVADGFGVRFSISGHDLHGLAMGPDGRLYFSIGDRGYDVTTKDGRHVNEPRRGAVFRCEPDGSGFEIFYKGLRNPQELAFNADGDLFTVDNNADMSDASRVGYLLEGGDSGWDHGWQLLSNDGFAKGAGLPGRLPTPWMEEGMWKISSPEHPAWILPPIGYLTGGPCGLAACPSPLYGPDLVDHFLVADFNGGVYSFKPAPAGAGFTLPDTQKIRFLWGFPPTDVVFGFDNRIYMSDWIGGVLTHTHGRILSVAEVDPGSRKAAAQDVAALVASGISKKPVAELVKLLDHPDQRVRQRAQFALVGHGSEGRALLEGTAVRAATVVGRIHSVWGLGQIARRDASATAPLINLLRDPEARIREQAAKMLGDAGQQSGAAPLLPLLTDASPRAQAFAAIALGALASRSQAAMPTAVPVLIGMLKANDDRDVFLRHAVVMGLVGCATASELTALSAHASSAVRMGALLALRQRADAGCAAFLADAAIFVRVEAIRAVYDLGLPSTMPALIAQLATPLAGELPKSVERLAYLRMVHAAWRWGDSGSPAILAKFAASTTAPGEARVVALQAIASWATPPWIDPMLGFPRPVVTRDKPIDPAPLKESILAIITREDVQLLEASVKLAQAFGYGLPDRALMNILTAPGWGSDIRIEALHQLADRKSPDLAKALPALLADEDGMVRGGAFAALLASNRAEGLARAASILEDDGHADRVVEVMTERGDKNWKDLKIGTPDPAINLAGGRPVRWVPGFTKPKHGLAKDGSTLPFLTDGLLAANEDDQDHNTWFDGNEARFVLDLRSSTAIGRVDAWSWNKTAQRAPQDYVLWGSAAEVMPDAAAANPSQGWIRLAKVSTAERGEVGQHASSVFNPNGSLGTFRWLMWQTLKKGTAFSEITVYAPEHTPHGLIVARSDRSTRDWESLAMHGPVTGASRPTLPATASVVPGFARLDPQVRVQDKILSTIFSDNMALKPDDQMHSIWFDGKEARFLVDLGQPKDLARIAAYSWNSDQRSAQVATIWASAADKAPNPAGKSAKELQESGWRMLAAVDSGFKGRGGRHGTSIEAIGSSLGTWRWLMWQIPENRSKTAISRIDLWPAGSHIPPLRQPLSPASLEAKRQVLKSLGALDDPAASALLVVWLDKLLADQVPPALHLDLITAASARHEPPVVQRLAAWTARQDSKDPLAAFRVCLEGGNVEKGQDIFEFNISQCIKCHSVDHVGGNAGPDLKGVGSRLSTEDILQSLIEPSAVVVPGYGQGSVTLKNGTTVDGAFLSQTDKAIEVLTADGKRRIIPSDKIESTSPPVSPMPPMGSILQPEEIRDLISYLSSLR